MNLSDQVARHNASANFARDERRRLRLVAGITRSGSWKAYKGSLEDLLNKYRDELETLDPSNPHILGRVQGKIELLRTLLSLEAVTEKEVARLQAAENKHREAAKAKDKFQPRLHTGDGL